ncbi:YfhO family protein [candidate division KSB1 bacterium]|nr:YfhO family protein [candidate division KSB1 bacterium]
MTKKKKKPVAPPKIKSWELGLRDQLIIALSVIVVALVVFYEPYVIKGLSPTGGDFIASIGKTNQINETSRESGEMSLWNPHLFSGMPFYHRITTTQFSIDGILNHVFANKGRNIFIWYLIGALGMFFLTHWLGFPVWGSLLSALAFAFLPPYHVLVQTGHFQQFRPIMLLPWILFAFLYLLKKANWTSLGFFTVVFSILIKTKHYQMVFYAMVLLFFIGIIFLINQLLMKKYIDLLKRFGILMIAGILAMGMSLQALLPIREYAPYSMRGGTGDGESTGLDYDYATNWSFAPKELFSLVIPNAFGGATYAKYTGDAVPQARNQMVPSYWGDFSFTEGGDYTGIIIFLLAVFGITIGFRKNEKNVLALGIFGILAAFLSFGRHLPFLYNIFFNYVPMFNKFRVPAMILTMIYFTFTLLAAYGFMYIYNSSAEEKKRLLKTVYIVLGISIFIGILPLVLTPVFNFVKAGEAAAYPQQTLELLRKIRADMLYGDLKRYFILAILCMSCIFLFIRDIINKYLFAAGIIILALVDLIPVNMRYFKTPASLAAIERSQFPLTGTDKFLLQDKDQFRIFPLESDVFNTNNWSYYHSSVGGYSPAKLRIYQDLIETSFAAVMQPAALRWNVVDMLNAKYLISEKDLDLPFLELVYPKGGIQKGRKIYLNQNVLKRAFFVGDYQVIAERQKRLNFINSAEFDPREMAVLEKELDKTIQQPDSADAQISLYQPNHIHLKAYTDKDALLVLSEIYYPKGWKAHIDGQETEIFKTNHVLRSIFVPAGQHLIFLDFMPASFKLSSIVSKILNAVIHLALLAIGGIYLYKKYRIKNA